MQERRRNEESQQLVTFSPVALAETIEIPKTGTSTVNSMTILQSVQPGIDVGERVFEIDVDPMASVPFSGDFDMIAYCHDKLRSLSEGEMQFLAKWVRSQ